MDFEEFYAANFHDLTVQLYAYRGSRADAQDVVQEACCRALARWPRLSQYDDPAGWVRRVAWNLATSNWRKTRRWSAWTPCTEPEVSAGPAPDHVDLVSALATLPLRQRQALVLHYLGDLSVDEIARTSRVPAGTVKSWMSRARTALSARLAVTDPQTQTTARATLAGLESFAPALSFGSPAGFSVSVSDELDELFAAWRLTARVVAPGVAAANRTVAAQRRNQRDRQARPYEAATALTSQEVSTPAKEVTKRDQ
jgi:RNA polymerase sigma-70 factor (ECF subfamily)